MLEYLIGADPELFLVGKDGKFKSAHNVIPGSKDEPSPVLNGAIQPDGVAAEFNIVPANTPEKFAENIRDVLLELSSRIEQTGKGYHLVVQPTATFDKSYFKNLPKRAKLLGCEPDFNVYTGTANPPPATKEPFRTGGGHIHVGWTQGEGTSDQAHLFDCVEMVRQLDCVLYPLSLLWDSDDRRRTLYGKIGTYRPKHYGVEYRPLSNAWVADPDLQKWVASATLFSARMLDEESVVFSNDYLCQQMVEDIRESRMPDRLRVLEYYDALVGEYNLPKMPEAYTRTHH